MSSRVLHHVFCAANDTSDGASRRRVFEGDNPAGTELQYQPSSSGIRPPLAINRAVPGLLPTLILDREAVRGFSIFGLGETQSCGLVWV